MTAQTEPKLDPATNTFSVTVVLYRRDKKTGEPMTDDSGEKIVDRVIGEFVFRVPTLWDLQDSGVRKAAFLKGMMGVVDATTDMLAEVRAVLPTMAVSVPKEWDWSKLYPKDAEAVQAVYEAYTAGLDRF